LHRCQKKKKEEKKEDTNEAPSTTKARVEIKIDGFPTFKGPTSNVVKTYSPGDFVSKWQSSGILVPHEGLRLMHQIFSDILQVDDLATNPWKLVIFAKIWNEWYWPVLHDHHDTEETLYFPAIQERVEKIPERFTKDHKQLIALGNKMTEKLQTYASIEEWKDLDNMPVDASLAETLKKEFDEFITELEDHLQEEETFLPGLLEEAKFTPQENNELIGRIIRNQGLHGNSLSLPLMLYAMHSWAGVEEINKYMLPSIPGPIKYMYNHSWLPKWRVCVLGNYEAVTTNNKEKSVLQYNAGGCCNCCSCILL